jgi:hypothetical protein
MTALKEAILLNSRVQSQQVMSVHVVADTVVKLSALRVMLEQQHAVTSELLSGASVPCSGTDAVVVTADLRVVENISALKEMFGKLGHVRKPQE